MRFVRQILLIILLTGAFAGCQKEKQADVSQVKNYLAEGLQFQYPHNWRVVSDMKNDEIRMLAFKSPGNAQGQVVMIRQGEDPGLSKFARSYPSSRFSRDNFLAETVNRDLSAPMLRERSSYLVEKFDRKSLGQIKPSIRYFQRSKHGEWVVYMIFDYPREDQKLVAPGFSLIRKSFQYNPRRLR